MGVQRNKRREPEDPGKITRKDKIEELPTLLDEIDSLSQQLRQKVALAKDAAKWMEEED